MSVNEVNDFAAVAGLTAEDQIDVLWDEASEADTDLMAILKRLETLAAARRKNPTIEREYEQLRDKAAAILKDTGPRYYLDSAGNKRLAFPVAPMNIDVDLAELERQVLSHEIEVDLEVLAPRKVDKEELRKAVATGRIPAEKFLKMASLREGTAHVRFADPDDGR